jgi:hypothetical protein
MNTPTIEEFAIKLCKSIGATFPTKAMNRKLWAVIQFRDDIPIDLRAPIARALHDFAARANQFADRLEK